MASENAKAVAQEVIKTVRNGKKINMQEIQQKHGYSKESAKSMKAKNTKTYKAEIKPLLDRLEEERDRAISLLEKTSSKAKYRDLVDGLDKITKNIQLLGGKSTEIVKVYKWKK
ncbi:MAG: hypothetical protein [Podoviridae sp. ctviO18]|nr:MAG: hypothetical protein [Podoviridae sp. ctviO18]